MRRIILSLAALAAVLVVPSLASAHTGSVACSNITQGATFTYQANFAHDTVVTEFVKPDGANGVIQTHTVHAGQASTDTVPSVSNHFTAWALWNDGNAAGHIGPVSLNCADSSPPPPPADCSGPPRPAGSPPCQPTVCVPTIQYVDVPGPATTTYVNVPGSIQYVDRVKIKTKIVYRTRIKWKTRIKLIPYHEVKQPKNQKFHSGVTG